MATAQATERRRICRQLRRGRRIASAQSERLARYGRAVTKAMKHGVPAGLPEGSPLLDVSVWEGRVCGLDMLNRELRRRERPGSVWHEPARDGRDSPEFLPPRSGAAWDWWESLEPSQRLALYEQEQGPSGDALDHCGLVSIQSVALINPAFIVTRW